MSSFTGRYHPRNIAHLRKCGVERVIYVDQPSEFAMIIIPNEPLRALPNGIKVRHHAVSKYAEFLKLPPADGEKNK